MWELFLDWWSTFAATIGHTYTNRRIIDTESASFAIQF